MNPEHYTKLLRNRFAALEGQQRTVTGLQKESKIGYVAKNKKKRKNLNMELAGKRQ